MSEGQNKISDGTAVIRVTNLDLAICLQSVGVDLRKDPPYTHVRLKNGEDKWVFNFNPKDRDGVYNTVDLVNAFREDAKWVQENPRHPFTFALCALRNKEIFMRHMKKSVPYVAFKAPSGATLYVVEGSRKHKNALAKGMIQI